MARSRSRRNSRRKSRRGPSLKALKRIMRNTHQPSLRRSLRRSMKNVGKGRGSRTRGWAANAPQTGKPRSRLMERCGGKCFLLPSRKKFPVCRKVYKNGSADCKPMCSGVTSALVRSRQYGYKKVARKVKALQKKLRCGKGRKSRSRR